MQKILLAAIIIAFSHASSFAQSNRLWFKHPAKTWTEALPLGNGRLGAMVFGGIKEELIQLNESTLWSGGPVKTNVNPTSKNILPLVRDALQKGDYKKDLRLEQK